MNVTWGIPPILIYDSYDSIQENEQADAALAPSIRFQHLLGQIQDESIADIHRAAHMFPMDRRPVFTHDAISSALARLEELSSDCPSKTGECSACHDSHIGADSRRFVLSPYFAPPDPLAVPMRLNGFSGSKDRVFFLLAGMQSGRACCRTGERNLLRRIRTYLRLQNLDLGRLRHTQGHSI